MWGIEKKFLVIVCLFFLYSQKSFAIEYGGVGIIPANPDPSNPRTESIFVETINPSETRTNSVLVVNNSLETKTLRIYATDSQKSSDGGFACAQYADPKEGVGNWISISQDELTIDPGKNQKVDFTIQVPPNAGVGEQNGCILVQERSLNQASSGASIQFRTGVRVAITIPGDQVRSLNLEEVSVASRMFPPKLTAKIRVQNTGNVSIDTGITILKGEKNLASNTYPILRGEISQYNIPIERPYWGGLSTYTIQVSYDPLSSVIGVDSGTPKTVLNKTVTVFLLPYPQAVGIIMLSLMLLFILYIGCMRVYYYRKFEALWTAEYIVKENEDLEKIAKKFRVSWKMIVKINKLKEPYLVKAGQIIRMIERKKTG